MHCFALWRIACVLKILSLAAVAFFCAVAVSYTCEHGCHFFHRHSVNSPTNFGKSHTRFDNNSGAQNPMQNIVLHRVYTLQEKGKLLNTNVKL